MPLGDKTKLLSTYLPAFATRQMEHRQSKGEAKLGDQVRAPL